MASTMPVYSDIYKQRIDDLLKQVTNPTPFSYDATSDPNYQSYAKEYTNLGDRAMTNAMSDASSLTGGQLNSWAVSAGSQAKDNYNQQLTDKIPQLYDAAYGKYTDSLNQKNSQLTSLQNVRSQDYGKYQNNLSQYNTEQNRQDALNQQTITNANNAKSRQDALNQQAIDNKLNQDQFNNTISQQNMAKQAAKSTGTNTNVKPLTISEQTSEADTYSKQFLYKYSNPDAKDSINNPTLSRISNTNTLMNKILGLGYSEADTDAIINKVPYPAISPITHELVSFSQAVQEQIRINNNQLTATEKARIAADAAYRNAHPTK
jgi:hypothetical protein